MELTGYWTIVRRWWWTLVVATWVAALTGFLVASQLPKVYEAEARLLVGPINTDLNTQKAAGQLAQTYAELLTSDSLVEAVIAELSLDISVAELKSAITPVPNDVTRLVIVQVVDEDPELAAQMANTLAGRLSQLAAATSGIGRPEGEVQIIDSAKPPTTPIAPQVTLIVLLAAAAGLLGAIVLVLLVEYLTDAIRSPQDVERVTDLPLLGTFQAQPGASAVAARGSREALQHRLLATQLELTAMPDGAAPRSLVIVGVGDIDGAPHVGLNLAAAMASSGRRVVIVDGQEDRATAHLLGIEDRRGLAEHLAGGDLAIDRVVPLPQVPLDLVSRGSGTAEPDSPETAGQVLDRVSSAADTTVIVADSIERSAAAVLWARAADATVVVVTRDAAKRESLRATVESLRAAGARIAGVVLVARPVRPPKGRGSRAAGTTVPASTSTIERRSGEAAAASSRPNGGGATAAGGERPARAARRSNGRPANGERTRRRTQPEPDLGR